MYATVRNAFAIARSGRPGPVLIDLPKDIATAKVAASLATLKSFQPSFDAPEGIEQARELIAKAERPLLYVGGGVIKANPFLTGRSIGYVKEWAELKMNRKGGASLPAVAATPPEVLAYQKIIAGLLGTPI